MSLRMVGQILMWGGFLAAAFVSMMQSDQVPWGPYGATAFVGAVGVVLLRRTATAAASDGHVVSANLQTLERSLALAVQKLSAMNAAGETGIFVYDVHGRIDLELAAPLAEFAEARESIMHGVGLAEYAAVMDPFARGERFVNRAWSASADGYVDEVWASLRTAEAELRRADELLRGYLQRG